MDGAQGQDGVEDGRLGDARLEEERRPEVGEEGAPELDGRAALEPVQNGPVLSGGAEQGKGVLRRGEAEYGAVCRPRHVSTTCWDDSAAAAAEAVAVAYSPAAETALTRRELLVAFHLADPGPESERWLRRAMYIPAGPAPIFRGPNGSSIFVPSGKCF